MAESAVLLGGKRTAVGAFQGALASFSAPQLAGPVLKDLITTFSLRPADITEVILGEVLSAGVGQAPARQAMLAAGLPSSVHALTVNKVCSSGLKAIQLARQSVLLGEASVVLAGGMESMSQAPYLSPKLRKGLRMGPDQLIDSMIMDGLWDPYKNFHMGNAGELCAKKYQFTRQIQDEYALESFRRAQQAWETQAFQKEVVSFQVPGPDKKPISFARDEGPFKADLSRTSQLKPAFDPNGTVTAANASSLSDGAAACVVTNETYARKLGVKQAFRILAATTFSQDPEWFTTAPVGALLKLETVSGIARAQWDAIELNEAFAVVPLAAQKELGLDAKRVNQRGGAIALGHPIGASGARIVVTLMHILEESQGRYGVVGICNGGGEATALLIERISFS